MANNSQSSNEPVAKKIKRTRTIYQKISAYREYYKSGQTKYLENVLKKHNFGQSLIQEFEREKKLSEGSDKVLCQILCEDLIQSVDR